MLTSVFDQEKLLVANRGEIAVRILRTARRLNIRTVAIYTQCDAMSPHVTSADEAAPLRTQDTDPASNARGYLDIEEILRVCQEHSVTMVHPGYGFLAENATFAVALLAKGVSWVGPRPQLVHVLGLKHEARQLAQHAGVPVVPSTEQVALHDEADAIQCAAEVGYPVMLKATAGGGGMGMIVCWDEERLKENFRGLQEHAQVSVHICCLQCDNS